MMKTLQIPFSPAAKDRPVFLFTDKQRYDVLGVSPFPAEHHQAAECRHGVKVTNQVRQQMEKL